MKGLIIRKPYSEWIVEGKKVWEIRKSRTRVRGEVLVISDGEAIGKVKIVDVLGPFTVEELMEHRDKHLVDGEFLHEYSRGKPLYAWVLEDAEKFEEPKKVRLKRGVQIWANVEGI